MELNVKNNKIPLQVLPGYYSSDIWDLTRHPDYAMLSDERKVIVENRNHVINFSSCMNELIAFELKFYCYNILENEKNLLNSFVIQVGAINILVKYINNKLLNHKSILDVGYDVLCSDYAAFLHQNGYKSVATNQFVIKEDMRLKGYSNPTIYFRFLKKFYQYLHSMKEVEKGDFFDSDKWDIRHLPYEVKGFTASRPRYTISFANITQEKIKHLSKKFVYEKLKTNKYSSIVDILKGINYLSEFLSKMYPEIDSADEISREMIIEFMAYVNTTEKLADRTKKSRIGSVKTFFETCMLFEWDSAPVKTLFVSDDIKKKKRIAPRFYDDKIIESINNHIEHLPVQIARMYYVLQNVGMRIGELCTLKEDCIQKDTENDYVLVYKQHKTNAVNRVPIKEDVARAITNALELSKKMYGDEAQYVFSQGIVKPISADTFSYHMNKLIVKHNITDENGKLVRIKSHTFRGTVATKYANLGMSPNVIRVLLGQKSLGAIKHYVEIVEETIMESMQEVLSLQDIMIQNIGKKDYTLSQKDEDMELLPLPNGKCAKPITSGKCIHANACYTCAMFKPDANNLALFKQQLMDTKLNLEMAKLNGFERIVQVNEDLATSLESIIKSIEGGGVSGEEH